MIAAHLARQPNARTPAAEPLDERPTSSKAIAIDFDNLNTGSSLSDERKDLRLSRRAEMSAQPKVDSSTLD